MPDISTKPGKTVSGINGRRQGDYRQARRAVSDLAARRMRAGSFQEI